MRENPPGCLQFADRRINADGVDAQVALGAFSRAISRGDPDERLALEALAWMRDRRAISPLLRGLRDPLWHLRHAAAQGLAQFRPLPDWSLQPMCAAIGDPEPAVRAEAARALGIPGQPGIAPTSRLRDGRSLQVRSPRRHLGARRSWVRGDLPCPRGRPAGALARRRGRPLHRLRNLLGARRPARIRCATSAFAGRTEARPYGKRSPEPDASAFGGKPPA